MSYRNRRKLRGKGATGSIGQARIDGRWSTGGDQPETPRRQPVGQVGRVSEPQARRAARAFQNHHSNRPPPAGGPR